MVDYLFNIIIYPITLIIESAYAFLNTVIKHNHGFAILGISFFISLLCLPLYAKAELIQEKERIIRKKMSSRIVSIRQNFKGDEQYMILSMYYRENHYHPIMALRSSLSLLIQIPFFIAAYSFLSHFELLKGQSFFIIRDLGRPDMMLSIGLFKVNILPIIMTLINIFSSIIYTKGFSVNEKLQLYIMSIIFLLLLYNAPSALALYWTCNNIFSLIKNIIFKLKNSAWILYIGILTAFLIVCIYVLYFRPHTQQETKNIIILLFLLYIGIPFYIRIIKYVGLNYLQNLRHKIKDITILFMLTCVAIYILCGIFIPFNVVASDPFEFSLISSNQNPFTILLSPIIIGFGLFIFWPIYIYFLSSNKVKVLISFGLLFILFMGIINTFVFPGDYGMLTNTLNFPIGINFSDYSYLFILNIIILLIILFLIIILYKKEKFSILISSVIIIFISFTFITILKTNNIQRGFDSYKIIYQNNSTPYLKYDIIGNEKQPVITLSKTGKNVIIIMLDRAVNSYLPLVFEDQEYLKNAFSGFVYYPNTVSYFCSTILGIPPLLGGYEYTPERLQERKNDRMVKKHNEAALMLPTLFKKHEYSASVFDIPYINYQNVMDTTFYTEKGIFALNLTGRYDNNFLKKLGDDAPIFISPEISLKRNFIMFSLFMIVPPNFRNAIYRNGSYWSATENDLFDILETINNYSVLYFLPELTVTAEDGNNFVFLSSQLTHKASFLQYPGYNITSKVTDRGPDFFNGDEFSLQNYHVHAAAFILLAKWFDTLRDTGIYDNTRIIIVADHDTACIKPLIPEAINSIINSNNPLLLFKDFNKNDEIITDMTFMTNADTPLLAIQDLFTNARNPFTGNELKAEKDNGVNILINGPSQPLNYQGHEAIFKDSQIYHVNDNIFDINNWTKINYNQNNEEK